MLSPRHPVSLRRTQKAAVLSLSSVLSVCRRALLAIAIFTIAINILALSGSLFMMEVYNRVLPSRSIPTLVGLSMLMLILLSFQGVFEVIRARILVRIGNFFQEEVREHAFKAQMSLPLRVGAQGTHAQPVKDLDTIRTFLGSQGPAALFDLPFFPLYLMLLFAFHVYLGLVALVGAVVVVILALLTETLTRRPLAAASAAMFERDDLGMSAQRAAETTLALGMERAMLSRLCAADTDALSHARSASDVVLGLGALSRMVRMMVHAGVLAVGAGLVIDQQATGGLMMASAVLSARALAPIDVAIANWRGFVAARQSWRRLAGAVFGYSEGVQPLQLAAPSARLVVKNLSVVLPGSAKLLLEDVSFTLEKGQVLAVLGHSASGKSSLARAVIGVWPPLTGTIRLDGATIDQWADGSLGRHVGYVAQRAELFDGTIAENVARFDTCARPDTIIAATRAAGIHELILSLPDGYQTQIRPDGHTLSAGQQQRIALARALYGEPFLVVLDEPYSSLDADGEAALSSAIAAVRRRGGIVVIISHHQKALAGADYLLFLSAGRVSQFGPTESFLRQSKRVLTASVQSVGSQ